jgi:cobalt/nickel transport system permease protein
MSSFGSHRRRFFEHLLGGLLETAEGIFYAEDMARGTSPLHRLDPRVKLIGLVALIGVSTAAARLCVVAAILGAAIAIALVARVPFGALASRVWSGALAFTLCMALPALFLTPGDAAFEIPIAGATVTRQGLTTAAYLLLRVTTAATLAFTLVVTTRWTHVLKALRTLYVPMVLVVVLGMTVRYIVLLLDTARQMFEAQRSRTLGCLEPADGRRLIYGTTGVLLGKTMHLSQEVHLAMQARGFRGEVYLLDEFQLKAVDVVALAALAAAAAGALWAGR